MPWRLASSRISRRGYIPGSWVRRPATKAAGWCAFSHADWYVGTANAAACALQNPNEANEATSRQTRSASAADSPRSFARRRKSSRASSASSSSERCRRIRSASARSYPAADWSARITCSW